MKTFFFGDHLILDRKTLWISVETFFGQKNILNYGKDLFFCFFLEITWFWTEKHSEFRRRPFFSFFWRSPGFHWRIASIQFQTNENLGQVRMRLNETSKKAPPLRNPGNATDRTTTTVLCFFSPSSPLRLRHCQLYFKPKNKGTTTCLPLAYDCMWIESFSPNFCGFLLLCTWFSLFNKVQF